MEKTDMNEDELLTGFAEDNIKQCIDRNMPTGTGFLDPHQQSVVRTRFGAGDAVTRIIYYGGYDDAERVMMICLPEYVMMPQQAGGNAEGINGVISDLMCIVRVTHSDRSQASRTGRPLSHSDYLGALMGLGLQRESVGDILVRADGADIIVPCDIADYIVKELSQAGQSRLDAERKQISELILPVRELKEYKDTVASLRLDNIVSSAFGLSRSKAVMAIKSGLVFVDHMEATKPSVTIKEGTEIVVRHKGRAIFSEVGGTSKKGRIYIKYLKD